MSVVMSAAPGSRTSGSLCSSFVVGFVAGSASWRMLEQSPLPWVWASMRPQKARRSDDHWFVKWVVEFTGLHVALFCLVCLVGVQVLGFGLVWCGGWFPRQP